MKKYYNSTAELQAAEEQQRIQRMIKQYEEKGYIDEEELHKEDIVKIIEEIQSYPDTKPDCLIYGWCMYIFVMIAGLIFNDYWILAIFATIYFFWWRHDKIERENGRRYDD